VTFPVRRLIIHPEAVGSRLAALIAERSGAPVTVAASPAALPERIIPPAKDTIFLAPRRGSLLKSCPGTAGHICCGYRVLNLVTGCPLDCTYCILQLYLNQPCLTVASNWEDAVAEVDSLVRRHPGRTLRLGTGELADSLALESLTDMAKELIPLLLRQRETILELKTKTTEVENLLDIDPTGRVIVSWSLNAEEVIKSDEKGAPPLEERLQAAARCRRAGYRIGFHFDPLVRFPGWEAGYRRAVEAIYSCLDPGSIAWISMGTLRYPPALDNLIRERFPESRLPLEELVCGLDGKLRYFRPLRQEMYRHVYDEIRRRDPGAVVYLCMESREVWQASLGWSPAGTAALARRLDDAAALRTTTS
jgi:spore photoproduct lyase